MKIKFYKRSTVSKNICLFIMLSPVFLQLVFSMVKGHSSLDLVRFQSLIMDYLLLWALGLFTVVSAWFGKRSSRFSFLAYTLIIFALSIQQFLVFSDKIILFFSFFYLIFSFYFFLFWSLELDEPIYKPGFSSNELGPQRDFNLTAKIIDGNSIHVGWLTNWNSSSCFVCFDEPINLKSSRIILSFDFEGLEFRSLGIVHTGYGNGFGIKIPPIEVEGHSWDELFNIIDDRGFLPRLYSTR